MKEIVIPASHVQSLVWEEDVLVDWVGGGVRFSLDGKTTDRQVHYAFTFDAAVTSPSRQYVLIYTRLGTKALLLRDGKLVREINRSFYHADVYEYPVALFALANGREVIAHCPDDYCRLEIDDLATGKRLTTSSRREPSDCFHSRLMASPHGTYLVSAGWLWHPVDCVRAYDVQLALSNPNHLDDNGLDIDAMADESSATFLSDRKLIINLDREGEEQEPDGANPTRELRIVDLQQRSTTYTSSPSLKLGTLMAIGEDHLLSLYQHPKLIHIQTNEIIKEWPDISSGTQVSSILMDNSELPPVALDAKNRRCAIAGKDAIHVLLF